MDAPFSPAIKFLDNFLARLVAEATKYHPEHMMRYTLIAPVLILALCCSPVDAQENQPSDSMRIWTDASGHYQVEADLIAQDETNVVLQRSDKSLLTIEIAQLSEKDQELLKSENNQSAEGEEVWTLANGLQVKGKIIEYGRREVTIKRYRARIYVNDRVFNNLPEVYQRMVPRIVSYFENEELESLKDLERWVRKQKGVPRTFTCDGVLVELPNGDLYGVPIFFFADSDRKLIEPGLEKYIAELEAAESADAQQQQQMEYHRLQLQAQTAQANRQQAEFRQFARLQLQLQGYTGGAFDLWEVQMIPPNNYGYPVVVVVPGRDSRQASIAASQKYPNYRVGAIAKVRRY